MKNIKSNEGIVLFISLIFLFISTLLGVSSLRSNFFNEKMTLSNIQREQALEAAEVALFAGEEFVENYYRDIKTGTLTLRVVTDASKDCEVVIAGQGGVCTAREQSGASDTKYDNWEDITGDPNSINAWTNSDRHRSLDDVIKNKYGLNTAPKYIVEFMGYIVDKTGTSACTGTALETETESWPYCSIDNIQFRITALATAGNYDETRVMLQSTYVVDN